MIPIVVDTLEMVTKGLKKESMKTRDHGKNRDTPDHSTFKTSKNTLTNEDLRKLAISQASVKHHPLKLVLKTHWVHNKTTGNCERN